MTGASPPLAVKLRVKFTGGDAEQTFDFTFSSYSKDR